VLGIGWIDISVDLPQVLGGGIERLLELRITRISPFAARIYLHV